MNWLTVLTSSLMAALGALVGGLIGGLLARGREGGARQIVVILCLVIGAAVGAQVLGPRASAWYELHNAEAKLLDVPVYRVLKKHEPTVYAKILAEYKRTVADPKQMDAFTSLVMNEVSDVTSRRMGTASQDSLIALIREMLGNLRVLQKDGDSCFRYLFPQVAGPIDFKKHFDEAAESRSLTLLAEVIRSSAEEPAKAEPPNVAQEKLVPVVQALAEEFGDDAQMLGNVAAPGVDRGKVCAITISLYDRILKLPEADAAMVLRSLAEAV
ncbi:MAG: hypothetical protein H7Y89_14470 [Steroidobacteraceae bacterium]|nr:hypothetical protein [Steroidobacteraceae bacterium]